MASGDTLDRLSPQPRPSPSQRGYNHAWQRLRDRIVVERGCKCETCRRPVVLRKSEAGPHEVANVDHMDGDPCNNGQNNLRVLCHSCHSRRTAIDQGFHRDKPTRLKGCDDDGVPFAID